MMDPRIASLAEILRLNTKLFRNCLDGLTDATANVRPSSTTNSAAFVAAHLAGSRFFLLRVIGAESPSPLARYLDGARSIDDVKQSPPLAEVQAAWTAAAHALRDRLDALTFLVQHDSYHLGQLALLRKHAGLPAMSYA